MSWVIGSLAAQVRQANKDQENYLGATSAGGHYSNATTHTSMKQLLAAEHAAMKSMNKYARDGLDGHYAVGGLGSVSSPSWLPKLPLPEQLTFAAKVAQGVWPWASSQGPFPSSAQKREASAFLAANAGTQVTPGVDADDSSGSGGSDFPGPGIPGVPGVPGKTLSKLPSWAIPVGIAGGLGVIALAVKAIKKKKA